VADAPHPYAAAQAGTRAYVDTLRANPGLARACFVEVLAAGPAALRRREAVLERFADQLARIYDGAAAVLDVLPPAPPRYVFRACVGAVNELVTRELIARGPEGLPQLAGAIFDVEMRLLVGHELAEAIREGMGLADAPRASSSG
jgi:hypothetical protein